MERLSREITSEFEEIYVPTNELEQRVQKALEIGQKRERKKSNRLQLLKVNFAAILVVGIIAVLAQSFWNADEDLSGSVAKDSILSHYGDPGINLVAIEGKTTALDLVEKSNGMTLKIKEVYFDESRVAVGYEVEAEEAKKGQVYSTMSFNGKDLGGGTGNWDIAADQTHRGILDFDAEDLADAGTIELNVEFSEFNDKQAEWHFQVKVEKEPGLLVRGLGLEKQDEGSRFRVSLLEETASRLELTTSFNLPDDIRKTITEDMLLEMIVVGEQPDGSFISNRYYRQSGNWGFAERMKEGKSYTSHSEFAPLRKVDSFKVIPYVIDYNKAITEPLKQGAVLSSQNGTIQLVSMTNKENRLLVKLDKGRIPTELIGQNVQIEDKNFNRYKNVFYRDKGNYVELYFEIKGKKEDLNIVYQPVEYFFEDLAIEVE
ncbi:DUF4179 domain-containing protein [Sutcliffiella horikoshii]|uniref:DUF4179 domain-containing protein n=1 Tax=Sutcliffiella horikoshii TaxID=79883 RepID=UPI00384A4DCC